MGKRRNRWTPEEETALVAGVNKHGPGKWKDILADEAFAPSLINRSNVDLKDKWRNLSCNASNTTVMPPHKQTLFRVTPWNTNMLEAATCALSIVFLAGNLLLHSEKATNHVERLENMFQPRVGFLQMASQLQQKCESTFNGIGALQVFEDQIPCRLINDRC
ncbi:hypothetical protein R6Q59_028730 [Mikania micrantha]